MNIRHASGWLAHGACLVLILCASSALGASALAPDSPLPAAAEGKVPAAARPRSLAEARAAKWESELQTAFASQQWTNETSSPLASYDARLLGTIFTCWAQLISQYPPADHPSQVEVEFQLRADGNIAGLRAASSNAGSLLELASLKAVSSMAPFLPWPPMVLRDVGSTQRLVAVTFCLGSLDRSRPAILLEQQHPRLAAQLTQGGMLAVYTRNNPFAPAAPLAFDPPNLYRSPFCPFTYEGPWYSNRILDDYWPGIWYPVGSFNAGGAYQIPRIEHLVPAVGHH